MLLNECDLALGSCEGLLYEIVDDKQVERIIQQYSPSVSMEVSMPNRGTWPAGKTLPVPLYSAGFFMNGPWFHKTYLPRRKIETRKEVNDDLIYHPDLKALIHPTAHLIPYYDHDGCIFLGLCSNSAMFNRKKWLSHWEKTLDAVCKVMEFNEEETAQAKKGFNWHIIAPSCYEVVPKDFTVSG